MATTPLTAGNDTVAVSQGPIVRVNGGSGSSWNNQVYDGLAGLDTLNVDESSTKTSYFTISMTHDGIFTLTSASGGSSKSVSFVNFEKVQFWDITMNLGTAGNDSMTGTTAAETIYAFDGNDTIDGGGGKDKMYGMAGNDTYILHAATDIVGEKAGEGNDTIQAGFTYSLVDTDGTGADGGNVENLILTGTAAIDGTGNGLNNKLTGNSAANILDGGAGNDQLKGGAGLDILIGGAGNDIYIVDQTGETVTELAGGGTDTVKSTASFTLANNVENLLLLGGAAINGTGNSGNNVITGNTGANVLTGGLGRDILTGKGGADRFDFNKVTESKVGAAHDLIKDFAVGVDHIDLATIDANTTTGGNQAFTFLSGLNTAFGGHAGELHFVSTAKGTTMVEGDTNGDGVADFQIELTGSIALTIGDFIL